MNDYISDIKEAIFYHISDWWFSYILAAVVALFVWAACHSLSQPPEIIVVDGCEYIRPRGQSLVVHKANCKNH